MIARKQYNFLKTYGNIYRFFNIHTIWYHDPNTTFKTYEIHRAIHTTCIVYAVLNTFGCLWMLNAILYCVFRIPNVFFLHSNNLIARNQPKFWTFFTWKLSTIHCCIIVKQYTQYIWCVLTKWSGEYIFANFWRQQTSLGACQTCSDFSGSEVTSSADFLIQRHEKVKVIALWIRPRRTW